jgi:hypothetical protein
MPAIEVQRQAASLEQHHGDGGDLRWSDPAAYKTADKTGTFGCRVLIDFNYWVQMSNRPGRYTRLLLR